MTDRCSLLCAIVVVLATLALPASASAVAGDLDTTFNGTGKVTTAFGTTPFHAADTANASARDGSGRIYVVGTTPANNSDVAVVRFTAGGLADTSFGGGDGIVTTDVATGSEDEGTAVLIDPDGKVVVGGISGDGSDDEDFLLARYTSAGVLDAGFGGGDGMVTTDFNGFEDEAFGLARLSSGNLVLVGYTYANDEDNEDWGIASYTSAGALDSSFDGDGKLTTDFGTEGAGALAVLATGSTFVVGGYADPTEDGGDFAFARYSASTGALDATFDGPSNGNGKFTVSFSSGGNGDSVSALTLDGSSRILAAGFAGPGNGDFAVARLSGTDGSLDTTFDTDGKQTISTPGSGTTINSQDQAYAVAVQPDGKILLAGIEYSNPHWMFARLSDAGVPDAGFGNAGVLLMPFGATPSATTQATGVFVDATHIVATGTADNNFAAARYATSDGALDTTFGPNMTGDVEVDVVSPIASSETATDVAVQADGKTVVVGPTNAGQTVQSKGDQEFGLARYNADGTLDPGFGVGGPEGNGRVTTNFANDLDGTGTPDAPGGVALQSDGKIVVAGQTDPPGSDEGDFAVARYKSDGTLDPSFGGDGLVTTDFSGAAGDAGTSIAIEGTPGDPGFRIVVAGNKRLAGQQSDFAVAAYDQDGDPDATFNGAGTAVTDIGVNDLARGVALQADGAIVVAGQEGISTDDDFALARYLADGTPDPSFGGGDGEQVTDFVADFDDASEVAIQELGAGQVRIVLGGKSRDGAAVQGAFAVYTTDGSLDPAFAPGGADGDGKLTIDLASNFDQIQDVVIRPDGRIIGSGGVGSAGFGLVSLTASGSPDTGFGSGGFVTTSFGQPAGQYGAAGMTLLGDGRVVAAGGQLSADSGSDFLVARYQADPPPPPPTTPTTPSAPQPAPTTPAKKKCKKAKKKKHSAASAAKKKCKKKKKR